MNNERPRECGDDPKHSNGAIRHKPQNWLSSLIDPGCQLEPKISSENVNECWNGVNDSSKQTPAIKDFDNSGRQCSPPDLSSVNLDDLKYAISSLEKKLRSESSDVQLEATKKFRQLLKFGQDCDPMTKIMDMLDQTVIPQLLHILCKKENTALQVEALWTLTNVAAGSSEHTHLLIKNNAIPILVGLLDSSHLEILEQALWVLGNVAGDGQKARDIVLKADLMPTLLRCLKENTKPSLLRIATWTLSNLCDGQPRPILPVNDVLATLTKVLRSDDTEVLSHACWALSHICDGPSLHIRQVVNKNMCPRLVELLRCRSWRVVKPALRTVGNIVCAEDDQDYTQTIIECKTVPCLRDLISHSNKEIQKEACWTLSNIAAGTIDQIQCVIDSGCIPTLIDLTSKNSKTDSDVRIEACWVILNATSCGNETQIQTLVCAGCISVLCRLLEDRTMVMMALEGLEKVLQVVGTHPDRVGSMHVALLDTIKIEALQKHRSSSIAKRATRLWNQHFVVCGICQTPYSRSSSSTKFCSECNCNVCSGCDCSTYHLTYQDALWKDLAEDEAKVEKSKQQSKKTRRKKKKAKDRKRKEMQKAKAISPKGDLEAGKSNHEKKGDVDKLRTDASDVSDSGSESELEQEDDLGKDKKPVLQCGVESDYKSSSIEDKFVPEVSDKRTCDEATENVDIAFSQRNGRDTLKNLAASDPPSNKQPDLVEALINNGSILDIWRMINDNDGDVDALM